jgi:hypothetical protein
LVLSARAMMLVSAVTIESPVTTVYRIAANAAAAIVPMAYSTGEVYTVPFSPGEALVGCDQRHSPSRL